jgi:hypothetical protein
VKLGLLMKKINEKTSFFRPGLFLGKYSEISQYNKGNDKKKRSRA